jgi:SNF2 family DNA or RNA helicase
LYGEDNTVHEIHGLKLEALESIVQEAGGAPVLVQYDFIEDKNRILEHFKQAVFLDDDPDTIKRWNAGRISMLVAHGKSAGHGLNLQYGGNILARYSYDWNLEYYMQILERIGPNRQRAAGLNRPVYDYPIIARGTIDEIVFERHGSKRTTQELLLEAMKRWKKG